MLRGADDAAVPRPRVVFVCDGNTCRSPLAEVLARSLFGEDFSCFTSAGLQVTGGTGAHPFAAAAAAARGLDLREHRVRSIADVVANGSVAWFIAMNRSQAARLRPVAGRAGGAAVGVLGAPGVDVARRGSSPECPEVADPWGGDADGYRETAARIADLLAGWRPYLASQGTVRGEER